MSDVLDVERGLPPGLWLPTADEPTDQYLFDVFNRRDHEPETVIDFGSFAVALAMLDANRSGRVSLMPTLSDLRSLREEGYGISKYTLNEYGGMLWLQGGLGFLPDGYIPSKTELMKRLSWMAMYALDLKSEFGKEDVPVSDIFQWGRRYDLLPNIPTIYKVLEGDSAPVRAMFGIEASSPRRHYTYIDLYRLGEIIFEEHGRPLSVKELLREYDDYFIGEVSYTIRAFFGKTNDFYKEFDYIVDGKSMSPKDVVDAAVRIAIRTRDPSFPRPRIKELSAQKRFVSTFFIHRLFKVGKYEFDDAVMTGYEEYIDLYDSLKARGIDPEVIEAVCQKYETGPGFMGWANENIHIMKVLSEQLAEGTDIARAVVNIMKSGFTIKDPVIFDMQRTDLLHFLQRHRISSVQSRKFMFTVIPKVNVDEALGWKRPAHQPAQVSPVLSY